MIRPIVYQNRYLAPDQATPASRESHLVGDRGNKKEMFLKKKINTDVIDLIFRKIRPIRRKKKVNKSNEF